MEILWVWEFSGAQLELKRKPPFLGANDVSFRGYVSAQKRAYIFRWDEFLSWWHILTRFFSLCVCHVFHICCVGQTNLSPCIGKRSALFQMVPWLEDKPFLLGPDPFSGAMAAMLVSGSIIDRVHGIGIFIYLHENHQNQPSMYVG